MFLLRKDTPDLHERVLFPEGTVRHVIAGREKMKKTRRPESSAGVTNPQRGVSGRLNDCTVMMSLKLGPESIHQLP